MKQQVKYVPTWVIGTIISLLQYYNIVYLLPM